MKFGLNCRSNHGKMFNARKERDVIDQHNVMKMTNSTRLILQPITIATVIEK